MRPEKIDHKAPEIMSALAKAPVFKKQGQVDARPAVVGEEIITTLEGGAEEMLNIAQTGDWIITNPSGEQYIVPQKKFFARYKSTDTDDVYMTTGSCRAITNPFGRPIEIMTSRGLPQMGDADCMIADTCDEDGSNMENEPYLIDADAFTKTYT
ncbi:MAG: hypothetical protein A2591_01625 [Candidatus Yonathbacteria bacterium RIFOXYD1_FULL_52_36]|uniref:Uncharacterized protein n=1 Tax=Candidatus Yonathbacteria bacterium RIFOXYD1_FULL_52_36 TaxID=1802730 RepID=A0A1G2SN63_9BACT|nr:MAG: hypothetical protein A2591_01625 [Candidatus Yonathbacteria bacterium RIFOXYD1_FULL_52_36]